MIHNFKDLKVWQKARVLVKDVYVLSASFPETEKFGVVSQIRRAVVSISNNICEGSGRGSDKDFARFLDFSYASACEVENLIFLCFDLQYIDEAQQENFLARLEEIKKMVFALKNKLVVTIE